MRLILGVEASIHQHHSAVSIDFNLESLCWVQPKPPGKNRRRINTTVHPPHPPPSSKAGRPNQNVLSSAGRRKRPGELNRSRPQAYPSVVPSSDQHRSDLRRGRGVRDGFKARLFGCGKHPSKSLDCSNRVRANRRLSTEHDGIHARSHTMGGI